MQTPQAFRQRPQQVRQILQEKELSEMYVKTATQAILNMLDDASLDRIMKASWQQCMDSKIKARRSGVHMQSTGSDSTQGCACPNTQNVAPQG